MFEYDPIFIVIFCLWFTILGACVGSFLNVFVYRFPQRKSIVYPPSHCPRCGHLIRWYDNVPVIGWIKLRGKCRDCQLPISVRYPCVEGFSGILFGGIFVLFARLFAFSFGILFVLALLASLLGCVILAIGLMMYDRMQEV